VPEELRLTREVLGVAAFATLTALARAASRTEINCTRRIGRELFHNFLQLTGALDRRRGHNDPMPVFTGIKCYCAGDMQHSTPPQVRRSLRQVADNLTTWRKLRGLTQAQLADRAGVHRDTISRLERGDGGVSLENVLRVLRGLGVIDGVTRALDPYESDVGRLRADEQLPRRVRTKRLTGDG
jgi:DNA-binding XRE family transcriptional regulator